jgi:hypothetical protein
MTQLANATAFFALVRADLFGGRLVKAQVVGCNEILKAAGAANWPVSHAAYALATAYHETAKTMEPIRERGGDAYLAKYDTGSLAARLGNTPEADGDGVLFCGRGLVQLTGHANYDRADRELDLGGALLANPDLALDPVHAAAIMVRGMGEGWFTGKSCHSYLPAAGPATREMFTQARRIINGQDCAEKIASYALTFQKALITGGWS